MRYKAFEYFGVEVRKNKKLNSIRVCETLSEAMEYARDTNSVPCYTCKIITLDKYGCKIQEL